MFSLRLTAEEKKSPSMRREWIEMRLRLACNSVSVVSLHAEGVD